MLYEKQKISFLKNHGLLVESDSVEEVYETTKQINALCHEYLLGVIKNSTFIPQETKEYYFPDAYVLKSNTKIKQMNEFIGEAANRIGPARGLTPLEIQKLDLLEAEKRRKAI